MRIFKSHSFVVIFTLMFSTVAFAMNESNSDSLPIDTEQDETSDLIEFDTRDRLPSPTQPSGLFNRMTASCYRHFQDLSVRLPSNTSVFVRCAGLSFAAVLLYANADPHDSLRTFSYSLPYFTSLIGVVPGALRYVNQYVGPFNDLGIISHQTLYNELARVSSYAGLGFSVMYGAQEGVLYLAKGENLKSLINASQNVIVNGVVLVGQVLHRRELEARLTSNGGNYLQQNQRID